MKVSGGEFATVFTLGCISFCIIYWIIVGVMNVWFNAKEKKFRYLWIESVRCTDKSIELLSKDENVIDVIPRESLYIFESRPIPTVMGHALKMIFLLKGDKKGPYFVKFSINSELIGYLQQI